MNANAASGQRRIVLPFFLAGAFYLFATAAGVRYAASDQAAHFFEPHTLALVHVLILGFCSMIAFGALYQLLPVIANKPLWSIRLPWITFSFMNAGVILLTYGFWTFSPGVIMQAGAMLLLLGVVAHCVTVFMTLHGAENAVALDCITAAHFWLLTTVIIGTLLVFNFQYLFLPQNQLHYLSLHAHLGIVGWFVLLIVGAASRIIPMLLLAPADNIRPVQYACIAINAGLILLLADVLWFHTYARGWIYAIVITSGIGAFICFVFSTRKKSVRKEQDEAMQQTFFAVFYLLVPIVLFALNTWAPQFLPPQMEAILWRAYGIALIPGFLVMLIIGQTFKTLPFIIWMDLRDRKVVPATVLPRHLYNARAVTVMFYAWNTGVILLLCAELFHLQWMWRVAGNFLIGGAVLYIINIAGMLQEKKYQRS
jgi:hypothetical protein